MEGRLRVANLSVQYGPIKAVEAVHLSIEPGNLTGLIGPNGAGKTSLIDAVTGFAPSTGEVLLNEHDISGLAPTERSRAGLARTWQSTMLFDDLTVEENITVASGTTPWWRATAAVFRGRRSDSSAANALLVDLGIEALARLRPSSLAPGQRKLVGIARALAANPAVVCLDEPAAGLNTEESASLGALLRRTADRGLTTLLVDHDMSLVLSVCDSVVVLDKGRLIFAGTPKQVQSDPTVIEAYLGSGVHSGEGSRAS